MLSNKVPQGSENPADGHSDELDSRNAASKRLTTLRVGAITIGERRELCLIRNVSSGGLKACVYSPLAVGDAVSFELKTNQQTSGRVSWVNGNDVGVQFDREIDVDELLSTQGGDGRQARMPRVEFDRLGELRIEAQTYPINTRDISQGGVRIEIDYLPQVGDVVVLTLEKFRPIQGSVRWCRPGEAGIAFIRVIPFKELMELLRS